CTGACSSAARRRTSMCWAREPACGSGTSRAPRGRRAGDGHALRGGETRSRRPRMTQRATLRGAARTDVSQRADVLICGASFAGLAVARELAGAGADVLVVDRYEIGERATSACAAPTPWL